MQLKDSSIISQQLHFLVHQVVPHVSISISVISVNLAFILEAINSATLPAYKDISQIIQKTRVKAALMIVIPATRLEFALLAIRLQTLELLIVAL